MIGAIADTHDGVILEFICRKGMSARRSVCRKMSRTGATTGLTEASETPPWPQPEPPEVPFYRSP